MIPALMFCGNTPKKATTGTESFTSCEADIDTFLTTRYKKPMPL
jgi:hypothetical protein